MNNVIALSSAVKKSILTQEGRVESFPQFVGLRARMVPFYRNEKLPTYLERFQGIVDVMTDIDVPGEKCFLNIEESFVGLNRFQEPPGVRVMGSYESADAGLHYWNFDDPSDIVVECSNHVGTRALVGHYYGRPQAGGSYDHMLNTVDFIKMQRVFLLPFYVYWGQANYLLLEPTAARKETYRTLIRINIRQREDEQAPTSPVPATGEYIGSEDQIPA